MSVVHATTSEADLQETVLAWLSLRGWRTFHDFDSRRNSAGLPDLVAVRAPRVIFIELKSEKGRVRPEQTAWGADLLACPGVEYYLVRPSGLTAFLEFLR